jgi:hypothetical protein
MKGGKKMPKSREEKERESDEELGRCGICEYRVTKGKEAKPFCIYPLVNGGQKGKEVNDDDWCDDFFIFD